ncbi:MAG: hypothetical protein QY303_04680 [Vicingaceae bacterium]|nr:MAG: hypothetical protein QY303_04680 [Vicingaceae bacterium]
MNIFRHTFCANTLLAHCHPRSCGGKELKPTLKQKDMPKSKRSLKNSLASQKLNLSDRSLPTDKKAFLSGRHTKAKTLKALWTQHRRTEPLVVTWVWQKWRCSAS